MSDSRVITADDGTVSPAPGFRWCPYCNGEGFVTYMDSSPNLDEHDEECGFCEDGISPDVPSLDAGATQ